MGEVVRWRKEGKELAGKSRIILLRLGASRGWE